VTSKSCAENCWNNYYDPDSSTSSTVGYNDEASPVKLEYGSSSATGSVYTDSVCMLETDSSSCASQMGFVAISEESGLAGLDGVLGMAPYGEGNGPSFVKTLYNEGKISE
jgi:hypothetical protein